MNTRQIHVIRRRYLAAALLALFTAGLCQAQPANHFTNATLNDRYGYSVIALHSDGHPFAVSGYYQFNGNETRSGKTSSALPSPTHSASARIRETTR
jgi:hypothetical protein